MFSMVHAFHENASHSGPFSRRDFPARAFCSEFVSRSSRCDQFRLGGSNVTGCSTHRPKSGSGQYLDDRRLDDGLDWLSDDGRPAAMGVARLTYAPVSARIPFGPVIHSAVEA
jgi:hypothetical protein